MAREGSETAPGGWLTMTLVQTMMANGLHDEAHAVIDEQTQDDVLAWLFHTMIMAHRGDLDRLAPRLDEMEREDPRGFFIPLVHAWTGNREAANKYAA